jgi:hypothetical protein
MQRNEFFSNCSSFFVADSDRAEFDRMFANHTAKVNNVHLHYVTGGRGEPIVLLHVFLKPGICGGISCPGWRKVTLLSFPICEVLEIRQTSYRL